MKRERSKKLLSPQKNFWTYFLQNWELYCMCIPGLLFLFLYKFSPLYGLTLAFKDYNLFAGSNLLDSLNKSPWVGFAHFSRIFSSPQFSRLLSNTIIISIYKLVFLFPIPIILAVLLNEMHAPRYKKIVQTVMYLPHFLSWVIIYGVFFSLLSSNGIVNTYIQGLGGNSIQFLSNPKIFRSVLVFTEGWKEVGWSCIIYLGALTSIDPALYEAATIDGASRFQKIKFVTIPGILSSIAMMLLLRVGNILQAGFEQILVMYNPAVYSVSDIIQTYVYRVGLGQMDFSTGTAMGMFESVVGFILIIICNKISRKFFERSLW
ncbi:MAG: sugar ABC transporter permease [Clostridia bacterium]|nr:sugar ABC transporter permease [Clostridia bacterium]